MRQIRNLADAQSAINDLYNFKSQFANNWNPNGFQINNVGAGVNPNDVATMSQLPTVPPIPTIPSNYYTIVFESPTLVTIGANISPPYCVGRGRTGNLVEIWLAATVQPTTGPLAINVNLNGNQLLSSNLEMNPGDPNPVFTSAFSTPVARLGLHSLVTPLVASVGAASLISIGIVIQVN